MVGLMISCCIMCFLNAIEFLTWFSLSYAALTGESFCDSGKTFVGHCRTHGFLKVVTVDWVASLTLSFGSFIMGLLVAAITTGLVQASVINGPEHDDSRARVLTVTASLAAVVAFAILNFIASILLDVIDASYCCMVLDLDNYVRCGAFHRPAIATVVVQKVKPDFVIVQPGGAYAVAQPGVPVGQPVGQP